MKTLILVFTLIACFSTNGVASIYLDKANWPLDKANKKLKGWSGHCPKSKVCYKLVGVCHPINAVVDEKLMTATCPKK